MTNQDEINQIADFIQQQHTGHNVLNQVSRLDAMRRAKRYYDLGYRINSDGDIQEPQQGE